MCYFQAGGKQSDHFTSFYISVHITVLDHRQVVPDYLAIRESMGPIGYPKTHAPLVPQAQVGPTHHSTVKGSRFPSKLGLQAPTPESRTLSVVPPPSSSPISRFGKSQNPRQESNEPSLLP